MQKEGQKIKTTYKKVILTILLTVFCFITVLEILYNLKLTSHSPANFILSNFSAEPFDKESVLVEFLDIGQGDCTVIKIKDSCALIDFGVADDYKKVCKRLRELGIEKIDIAFVTHLHNDHIGGFPAVAENFKLQKLVVNSSFADNYDSDAYNKLVTAVNKNKVEVITPKVGMEFNVSDAYFKILYNDITADDENNRSLAVLLNIFDTQILFTGDGDEDFENNLTKTFPNLKVDVLKLGHHGSKTSSAENFIKQINPLAAVASSGYNNTYNHPAADTVSRIKSMGIKFYRTDLDGNITLYLNKQSFEIITERQKIFNDSLR